MSANENNLIWIDLEMTGLDPERDRIIEIWQKGRPLQYISPMNSWR